MENGLTFEPSDDRELREQSSEAWISIVSNRSLRFFYQFLQTHFSYPIYSQKSIFLSYMWLALAEPKKVPYAKPNTD